MKTCKMLFQAILIAFLFTGCRSLQTNDYKPNKSRYNCASLSLEALIDYTSFENTYLNKPQSDVEVLCQPQQDFNQIHVNDVTTVINEDVKQNFELNTLNKKGDIVFRIKKIKGNYNQFWSWAGAFTLTVPWLVGAPVDQYKFEVWIDADIRNLKNKTIATYSGCGKYTATLGYYYGCKQFPQMANIQAVKRALGQIKHLITIDKSSLDLKLNQCVDEIRAERNLAAEQIKSDDEKLNSANDFFNNKDYSSSIKLYDEILEKYPNHIFALINKGRAQSELGSNNAAIKNYNRVIELAPNYADVYFYKGLAAEKLLEPNAAIYDFSKAIKLSPEMTQAYLMKGATEEDLGLNSYALKDYQQALKINPDLTYARERINAVRNIIEQNQIQAQQQAAQDRINRLEALSNALGNLSNTLNTISNSSSNTSRTNSVSTGTSQLKSNPSIQHTKVCKTCGGLKTCKVCHGTGLFSMFGQPSDRCKACGGSGLCWHCHGTGVE